MTGTEGENAFFHCPAFHIDTRVRHVDKLLKMRKQMKEPHCEPKIRINQAVHQVSTGNSGHLRSVTAPSCQLLNRQLHSVSTVEPELPRV